MTASETKEKAVYCQWAKNTTCHGVADFHRARNPCSSLFWFLLILICCGLAVYQIEGLIEAFVSVPHYQSSIYTKNERVTVFPNVTVCNFNRANVSKTRELGLNNDALSFLYLSMIGTADVDSVTYGVIPLDLKLTDPRVQKFLQSHPFLMKMIADNQSFPTMGFTDTTTYASTTDGQTTTNDGQREGPKIFLKEGLLSVQYAAWLDWYNDRSVPAEYKEIETLFRYLGHDCKSTLVGCLWAGHPFDCCESAKPVLTNQHGLCWSINPPLVDEQIWKHVGMEPQKKPGQIMPGSLAALKIIIDPNVAQYQPTTIFNDYLEEGIVISASFEPYSHTFLNPLAISTGSHARVALTKTESLVSVPKFPIFARDCDEKNELPLGRGIYNSEGCMYECFLSEGMRACGCMLLGETKSKPLPTCQPQQIIECFYSKVMEQAMSYDTSLPLVKCFLGCRETCAKRFLISTSVTYSKFAAQSKLDHMLTTLNLILGKDWSRENLALMTEVDVFYPQRQITIVETKEVTSLFELIGNIGGQLGLWMGVSIVTLIQAVYYFIYGGRKMAKKKQKVDNIVKTMPPPPPRRSIYLNQNFGSGTESVK